MKFSVCIFIFLGFLSCSSVKRYKLYKADKSLNYPKEKLAIELINDTTGLFINSDKDRETFNQRFIFKKADKFLMIDGAIPASQNLISLKQGDTIVIHKKRLLFFYKGDKKYLLYFKRK